MRVVSLPQPAATLTITPDEELLRSLLADPDILPILQALNDVLGGPIDDPNFAVWRAVDADAIRRLGLTEGLIDSGLHVDLDEADWRLLADRLGVSL